MITFDTIAGAFPDLDVDLCWEVYRMARGPRPMTDPTPQQIARRAAEVRKDWCGRVSNKPGPSGIRVCHCASPCWESLPCDCELVADEMDRAEPPPIEKSRKA